MIVTGLKDTILNNFNEYSRVEVKKGQMYQATKIDEDCYTVQFDEKHELGFNGHEFSELFSTEQTSLTDHILPYPYRQYTSIEQRYGDFKNHKKRVYNWAYGSTPIHGVDQRKLSAVLCEVYVWLYDEIDELGLIVDWCFNHIDKLKYMTDFSGVEFGIKFNLQDDSISIVYPTPFPQDEKFYPGFNTNEFKKFSIIEKLNWMYEHCAFIPVRRICMCVDEGGSHKFKHIKTDLFVCKELSGYLNATQYQPNDNVYYHVWWNRKHGHYLKRDLNRSPKGISPVFKPITVFGHNTEERRCLVTTLLDTILPVTNKDIYTYISTSNIMHNTNTLGIMITETKECIGHIELDDNDKITKVTVNTSFFNDFDPRIFKTNMIIGRKFERGLE